MFTPSIVDAVEHVLLLAGIDIRGAKKAEITWHAKERAVKITTHVHVAAPKRYKLDPESVRITVYPEGESESK